MDNKKTYRKWRQDDPAFNEKEAWPGSRFPDAEWHMFREKGCLVTALAIMLRHFSIEKEKDERLFNPWILNQRLIACGAFDSRADLNLRDINRLYSLDYSGAMTCSRENLQAVWETGQPFLIAVAGDQGERHFLVAEEMAQDDLVVIDPLWDRKYLSEYDQVIELLVFWRNDEGMMYCAE